MILNVFYSLTIYVLFYVNCLFRYFTPFLLVFLKLIWKSSLCFMEIRLLIAIMLLISWCFYFMKQKVSFTKLAARKRFSEIYTQIYDYFYLWFLSLVLSLESLFPFKNYKKLSSMFSILFLLHIILGKHWSA